MNLSIDPLINIQFKHNHNRFKRYFENDIFYLLLYKKNVSFDFCLLRVLDKAGSFSSQY